MISGLSQAFLELLLGSILALILCSPYSISYLLSLFAILPIILMVPSLTIRLHLASSFRRRLFQFWFLLR